MHNLFLVYFVNRYMFRAFLCPSSGGITVCIQQLVLILFWWMSVVLDNRQSSKKNTFCIKLVFLYTIISRCTVKETYFVLLKWMQIIYKGLVFHSCTWANFGDIRYFVDNLTRHRDWVEVTEIRQCKTLHTP